MKLFEELYKAIEDEDLFKHLFEQVPPELKIQILTHMTDLSLFLQACYKGAFNVCRLLMHEAKIMGIESIMLAQRDNDPLRGGYPIHYATWIGSIEIVMWLIGLMHPNNDLTQSDLIGNTPMLYAIYGGHILLVKLLYTQMQPIEINTLRNNKGHTAIIQAACGGNVEIIIWLLERGCNITERDNMGNTSLLFAVWGGHIEAIRWLLENGSSITETNDNGNTVLLSAINSGNVEVVKWLLEEMHLSPLECNLSGDTCIILATSGGHYNLVRYLIHYLGYNIMNQRNYDGLNALLSACNGGNIKMVEMLITEYGLSLNEYTYYSPLILAACGGHLELVKWLVAHGCSVTHSTQYGDTALLLACYYGHTHIAKWLLDNGASITECDMNECTPLISAASGGYPLTCEMLILNGADIEAKNNDGYTALLLSARRNHKEVVEILLAYGANANARINTEATIFDLLRDNPDLYLWMRDNMKIHHICFAIKMGWEHIAKYCLYNGSSINIKQLIEYKAKLSKANPTYIFIQRILNPWTFNKCFLYGPHIRKMAVLLLKIRNRLELDETRLPYLPVELWDIIFDFVPRTA